MGLRLANLDVSDWDRTPSKRDPRFRREVSASSGILIRDMAGVESVALSGRVGFWVVFLGCFLGMLEGRGMARGLVD